MRLRPSQRKIAKQNNITLRTVHSRINKGWDVERAITQPLRKYHEYFMFYKYGSAEIYKNIGLLAKTKESAITEANELAERWNVSSYGVEERVVIYRGGE